MRFFRRFFEFIASLFSGISLSEAEYQTALNIQCAGWPWAEAVRSARAFHAKQEKV